MTTKLNTFVLILFLTLATQAQINHGLWSTGCKEGLKKEQVYDKNNKVVSTESFYQDAACSHESFRFQTLGRITYYQSSNNFIDFTYEVIYLSIFKQNVIDDFNARKVCGYADWALTQAQNITGRKCAIFNIHKPTQIPTTEDIKYGIFQIAQNKLYYGKLSQDFDGSSPERRPVQINALIEYIFQNSSLE